MTLKKKVFPVWKDINDAHRMQIRSALREDENHELTFENVQKAMLTAFPYYGNADRLSIENAAADILKEYLLNGLKD